MSRTVRLLVGLVLLGALFATVAPSVYSMGADARDRGKGGGAEPDIAFMQPNQSDPTDGGDLRLAASDASVRSADRSAPLLWRRWIENAARRFMDALFATQRMNGTPRLQGVSR